MGSFAPVKEEPKKSPVPALLILLAVIIALIAAGFWWGKGEGRYFNLQLQDTAPAGKLVEGFSKDLILVKDADISRSHHSIATAKDGRMADVYVTTYKTSSSSNGLFEAYLEYMRKNGFEVTSSQVDGSRATIFARRTVQNVSTTVIIAIASLEEATREVSISINRAL